MGQRGTNKKPGRSVLEKRREKRAQRAERTLKQRKRDRAAATS